MLYEGLEGRVLLSRSWFVSPTGSDEGAGSLASPFRTIGRAASLARAGDTVYLRAGVYRETVTPAASGTAAAPITFEPYGNEKVTVSGADVLGGWTPAGNGAWTAPMPFDLGVGNNQVFVNGRMMNEARWPNTSLNVSAPAFATVTAVQNDTPGTGWSYASTMTIYNPAIPGANNALAGATIHFGAGQEWVIQTGRVLSSTAGSVTVAFEHLTDYENPAPGNHFYLSGAFHLFDAPGEWYRDPSSGRLYLSDPAGDAGNALPVEARRRQFAFELSGRSWVNVQGINLFAAGIDTDSRSAHLTFSNLNAQYVSHQTLDPLPWSGNRRPASSGLLIRGSHNTLEYSTIAFSSGNGVSVSGSDNVVRDCSIHDVDYAGGDQAGIDLRGARQWVLANAVWNTGRDGILATSCTATQILYNTVHDVGLQTTDLGGVYTWGSNGGGTVIAYNTIYNVRTGGFGGIGVYLDNGSSHYVVHDNTIYNTDAPLKLNPPSWSNSVYANVYSGTPVGSQVAAPSFAATTRGSVTDLGTFGGFRSAANAINNLGQVVGSSLSGYDSAGFFFDGAQTRRLPTLGGNDSVGSAINDLGQIAGTTYPTNGGGHAVLYAGNGPIDLGVLPGDASSAANGINRYGQVVGVSFSADGVGRAFFDWNGRMQPVRGLGGAVSEAFAINDSGVVAGASTTPGNRDAHAFINSQGWVQDLGTLGGNASYALALNNAGQVVGESQVRGNGAVHAFLYTGGRMRDLGSLPGLPNSVATAINNKGNVVGYAYSNDFYTYRAFLYRNGTMYDLTRLAGATGWAFQQASAINDSDQIAGTGINPGGGARGYRVSV